MYRSMGSIAFVAAARSSWLVSADPDETNRRLFTKVKCNVQEEDVGGLTYRIGKDVEGIFQWGSEPVWTTADATLEPPEVKGAQDEAKEMLLEMLKDGPVPSTEIWERVKADGLCEKTVKLAKKALGIQSEKAGKGEWSWRLPAKGGKAPY
jgi:hypothetical protein